MKTLDCVPRDTLRQYLAGWIDEPQAAAIEQHLQACDACEQTVVELESKPDTILTPLQHSGLASSTQDQAEALLRDAVAKADRLVGAARAAPPDPSLTGTSTIGPYELLQRLGHGGMGTVYLARHKQLGKQVAVKLLPASWAANDDATARFRRETLAVGKLNHSAIVNATDAGEENGAHYLVMEYVDGIDLSQLVRVASPLRIADACEVIRQVAMGLSYAHAEGVVHRDIKPSIVMLDRRGQVKILDFGLAQLNPWDEASAELTSVGQLMGTLDYMAPEQAERPNGVDYRADLYSLGATLFRLLAGRAPLSATPNLSPLDKLRLLAEHTPPRLDTLRPDAPAELVRLVESLLARRPEARPASAAHVAEQLTPLCDGAELASLAARACASRDASPDRAIPPKDSRYLAATDAGAGAPNAAGQPRGPWTTWLVATGLIAALLFAGVLIVLETSKGQLVIESEVPGVHVQLLRDGQPAKDWQLHTGTTSTKLAADRYEIVLDSPSDSILVENDKFVLKNGETVVARVRRCAAAPPSDPGIPAESEGNRQPLYDGKSLDRWLEQLGRERSPKAIGEAMTAVDALVQDDTADRIVDALLVIIPTIDGEIAFDVDEHRRSSVDYAAFSILRKARKGGRYFELMAQELQKADKDWGVRILMSGVSGYAYQTSNQELEPLLQWIESAFDDPQPPTEAKRELLGKSGLIIWSLLQSPQELHLQRDKIQQRFLPRLIRSTALDMDFWLASLPNPAWSAALRDVVLERAQLALQDSKSSSALVAQAAMILTQAVQDPKTTGQLDAPKLADAVRKQLANIVADHGRLWRLVDVPSSFDELSMPAIPQIRFQMRSRGGPCMASETLELLELVVVLKAHAATEIDLTTIVEAALPAYRKVNQSIPFSRKPPRGGEFPPASVTWPTLDNYNVMGLGSGGFPGGPRSVNLVAKDWIGFMICIKAAEVGGIQLSPPADAPAENP